MTYPVSCRGLLVHKDIFSSLSINFNMSKDPLIAFFLEWRSILIL